MTDTPRQLLAHVPEGAWVSYDTETSGLHPDDGARVATCSVAWLEGEDVVGAAFPFDQGVRDKLPHRAELDFGDPNLPVEDWEWLMAWLARRRLVMHNAKFDLTITEGGTRHWPGPDLLDATGWDTMIAQSILDPLEPQGLESTGVRLGIGGGRKAEELAKVKASLKALKLGPGHTGRYDLAPWDSIREYATVDAVDTLNLFYHQLDRFGMGEARWSTMRFKMQVMRTLRRMEGRGIGYDIRASMDAAVELGRRQRELGAKLPFTPTPHGAKRYFFEELGEEPIKRTPKGAPSLDDETLQGMAERGVPWAPEWHEWTRLGRAESMWYRGYPEAAGDDGRLRTVYKQTRVKTGRMAVERMQLQAIPKNDKALEGVPPVKGLFRPKVGHELWNLDLSQAELRVAAKYARCKRMLALLAGGADLHGVTTQAIFSITPDHPEWSYKRDIAKRLTFGGIFQIGAKKFQATLSKLANIHLPLHECEEIVAEWRRAYPEFGQAYYRAMRLADRHNGGRGWVRLMAGTEYEERSYFGPGDYPNSAWNRIVQGSLALYNQIWLTETERRWPGYLVLNVHDSQVLEVPVGDEGAEIAAAVADHGAALATELFKTPMRVDRDIWIPGVAA